jgi:hypothetical protein
MTVIGAPRLHIEKFTFGGDEKLLTHEAYRQQKTSKQTVTQEFVMVIPAFLSMSGLDIPRKLLCTTEPPFDHCPESSDMIILSRYDNAVLCRLSRTSQTT